MALFSILVFVFGCLIGGCVTDLILNRRYNKRWAEEYLEFQDAKICRLKQLYLTKKLMLHYLDAMKTIWVAYARMLGSYETITKNFELLDNYPEMSRKDRAKLLRDIRDIALARYGECMGTDATYAKLLGINMEDTHIWDNSLDITEMAGHGEDYRKIEEELRIMKEKFHDIDEETEELDEVK